MGDRSNKVVLELLRLPENSKCADCGNPDPQWVSCNIGVFVSLQCSGVHRTSTTGNVKSTQLDYWGLTMPRSALVHGLTVIMRIAFTPSYHTIIHHKGYLLVVPPVTVWVSCNIGVFVCLQCSGVHRTSTIGNVKSTQLDYLGHDLMEFMRNCGNEKAKEKFEACVPPFYYRPTESDCSVLKEQWIRAKYERQEFTRGKESLYAIDYKEGFLWKKGRGNIQFMKRLFVYSENEGVLKYYTREKKFGPKAMFPIQTLNTMFQVEKIGHSHGLEITCVQDGRTRSIYVYHRDGKEIVTWYNVLRYARFKYLKSVFPEAPEAELIPKITRSYTKTGYMEKTGPTQREAFKKRWFTLDAEERRLLYYKKPLDPYEQGGVFIGSKRDGYQVAEGLPKGIKGNRWDAGITITTPGREYVFTCENTREQWEWLEAIKSIMSRPVTDDNV